MLIYQYWLKKNNQQQITKIMKLKNLLFLALFSVLLSCGSDSKENLVVYAKYKTIPNKNIDAVVAIKAFIEEVKKEDHFKEIRMYIDPNDNSNILLYQEWDDEVYYKNDHMQTEHLQRFESESSAFLVGPPEISYWRLSETFK